MDSMKSNNYNMQGYAYMDSPETSAFNNTYEYYEDNSRQQYTSNEQQSLDISQPGYSNATGYNYRIENKHYDDNSSIGNSCGDVLEAAMTISQLSNTANNVSTFNIHEKSTTECTVKPPYSYIALITMALENSAQRKCTLRGICDFIESKFPYYRQNSKWHSTIRHNLTLNDCFKKAGRRLGDKGCQWTLDPEYEDMFKHGSLQRRKFRLKAGRVDKYNRNKKYKKLKQVDLIKIRTPKRTVPDQIKTPIQRERSLSTDSGYSSCDTHNSSLQQQSTTDIGDCVKYELSPYALDNIPALDSSDFEWSSFSSVLQYELNTPSISDSESCAKLEQCMKQETNLQEETSSLFITASLKNIMSYSCDKPAYLDIPDLYGEFSSESINNGFNNGYY